MITRPDSGSTGLKAMIFAAGMGTRLQPLTLQTPKAMVEVDGHPLIYWILRRFRKLGIRRVVVNVFHHADILCRYLSGLDMEDMEVLISDERPSLLDTGGGLQRAKAWLGGDLPILLHNVDILCDIDIHDLLKAHHDSGALATLAVRDRDTSRKLLFDDKGLLVGWRDKKKQETRWVGEKRTICKELAFSGIHMISPQLLTLLPAPGIYSIIDVYLNLAERFPVKAYLHDTDFWTDLGKPTDLEVLHNYLPTPQGLQWKESYLNPS